MNIASWLMGLLSIWWIWLPIVVILAYLTRQNQRKIKHLDSVDPILLLIEIPRNNDKKELAAEQMFASLHGILRSKKELAQEGGNQEHFSFEIVASKGEIKFYIWTPRHLQSFVEGQIYAQYPNVNIFEAPQDYTQISFDDKAFYSVELNLSDNQALPIRTFQSFEVDPLAATTSTLAKLEQEGEVAWIQILTRPVDDKWHNKSASYIQRIKNGRNISTSSIMPIANNMLSVLSKPPESNISDTPKLSERDQTRIREVEEKSQKIGFAVKIRIGYVAKDEQTAKLRTQNIVGTFKQFTAAHLNSFKSQKVIRGLDAIAAFRARFFLDKGFVLNIEELASVYHLPHTNVETPNIAWATTRTSEPPSNLPIPGSEHDQGDNISTFAVTNFRGHKQQFGLLRSDRSRHVYIIGQTGVGKSKLLELFTISDIYLGQGFGVIDPHGDYANSVLGFIPPDRVNDVVYFNPADSEYPMAFNPIETDNPAQYGQICSELIGVFKRMFGHSWGPRLEYILRYTTLALLEAEDTTMLDITRMLTDEEFREAVLDQVTDPLVLSFWNKEFASWNENFAVEAITPVLNKVGAFTANPLMRNIVGQPKSAFNLRQIMDEGKIFVANLSRGQLGEDNAAILGALLVTKMQLAAMSRADSEIRKPFYLYVDEFQNFATDSFAVILSEARKYGLCLTVANQYINQMSKAVKDAVFGNVGTLISFRVGAEDAEVLDKYFAPQLRAQDLSTQHNRNFITSMVIEGEKVPAFTGTTLSMPNISQNYQNEVINYNRRHRSHPRSEVEFRINSIIEYYLNNNRGNKKRKRRR